MRQIQSVIIFILCVITVGCGGLSAPVDRTTAVSVIPVSSFPEFADDMSLDGITHALEQNLIYLNRVPATRTFQYGPDRYTAEDLRLSTTILKDFFAQKPAADVVASFISKYCRVYQSVGASGDGDMMFTGYYEPNLYGSRTRDEEFRYPVYGRPDDIMDIDLSAFGDAYAGKRITGRYTGKTVVPYHDRKAIEENNRMNPDAPVLAWVNSRVDLFFLQIQGSGIIFLKEGGVLKIHYAGANGHPYRSIGKYLIDENEIPREEMSMQRLRLWLSEHPDRVSEVLNHNPSYVFFEPEPDGPKGCLGVTLTPGRSIAIDRRLMPDAAFSFITTEKPVMGTGESVAGWQPLYRFVVTQDTGGAIRGAGRADVFWGNGPYARVAAGHMQHPGALFFIVIPPEDDDLEQGPL